MASLEERIAALENFELQDGQPTAEAATYPVAYDATADLKYVDCEAFESKWTQELKSLRKLNEIIERGDYFVNMVYTYRSCSKALPQVKTQDDPNKAAIYEKTYGVLEPEINKLKDFMYFARDTTKLFCEHVKALTTEVNPKKKKPKTYSELYIFALVRLLDLLTILDQLKDMKACLNNDFSFFKRALGYLRKTNTNDDQTQENHSFYLFLAHRNSITTTLQTEVQQIAGYDDVMALLVNQCARYMENKLYVTPTEKHRLLRVMPYALFLMDGDNERTSIFKSKKVNLPRFAKLFKKYPIVPLYGDMQISLEQTIKRSPNFDEKSWESPLPENKLAQEYELQNHLEATRVKHNRYLAKFSNMINQINITRNAPGFKGFSPKTASGYTKTVLDGLLLLSEWSGQVLRQSAWKYARPTTNPEHATATEYERVVKYNYTEQERFTLVEYIAFIKGVAGVMLRHESLLAPIIRSSIHNQLQQFIQGNLREMIAFASKKKKAVREELLQLRKLAADWHGGVEPDDPALFGKKVKKGADQPPIPERPVGPSLSQLDLIRAIIYGFLSHRMLHVKNEYSDKDFSSSSIKAMEEFYQSSFFFPYLLNYAGTIHSVTDLADLWYREFYLELSKRLQFPIEMSLPWILTDSILESRNASMTEFMLYPLDLYNDAATRALKSLKRGFLYDEIEAEVNLCFDQLIFKISEQIYTYFKIQASSILLDKPYKKQLELINSAGRFQPPKSRYDVILKQRHFELLGRSIDMNHLISQRANTNIRQNIDFAISRFEASDITTVVELESQLNNIRLTHSLLANYLSLDPFEQLLNEVNESISLVSFHGRIVLHIIFELVYDFFPNFNFNSITQRFTRSSVKSSAEEVPRDSMPKPKIPYLYGSKPLNLAYANVFELYQHFVGSQHIQSMLRLVGRTNLPLVVGECLENMNLKLTNVLVPYVRELFVGMPQSSKLPIFDYGPDGNYLFFKSQLKDLMAYPELLTAFQHFKEFGNTIILLVLFEQNLAVIDIDRFMQAAPFLGITQKNVEGDGRQVQEITESSPLYSTIAAVTEALATQNVSKSPNVLQDLLQGCSWIDKHYRPSCPNLSLFKAALNRMSEMVARVKPTWSGHPPENGIISIDSTTEFYRLWSALQFVFCLPPESTSMTHQERFGDGFAWGGSALIYLLRQENRFCLFDFCYHILNVQEAIPMDNAKDPSIHGFLPLASQMRDLNQAIYNILRMYHPLAPENILLLHPPKEEHGTEFISSTQGGSSSSDDVFIPPPTFRGEVPLPPVDISAGEEAPPLDAETPPPLPPVDGLGVLEETPPPLPPFDDSFAPPDEDAPPPPVPRD
ncbi:Cytoplasmic FMR1-interacting protein [Balamuthia mandrillaris]